MKTIFRAQRTKDFSCIPNDLLRDASLSFRARGLLCMILSHNEEWEVRKGWLDKQGTEGREAIASALKELERAGYAVLRTLRDSRARTVGKIWTFHDEPVAEDQRHRRHAEDTGSRIIGESTAPINGFSDFRKNRHDGKPIIRVPVATKKTILKENHLPEKHPEKENHPPKGGEAETGSIVLRLFKLFNRRATTRLSVKERKAFREAGISDNEDLRDVEEFYADSHPEWKGENYRRRDLQTLLNNWPGEVTKAVAWKVQPPPTPQTSNWSQRGQQPFTTIPPNPNKQPWE